MNKTINQLDELTTAANDDELILYDVSASGSRKIKKSNFNKEIKAILDALIPVGTVTAYYGTSDPSGWFICDGRNTTGTANELQTHYPKLYNLLGNSNVLPNLRGKTIVGLNSSDTNFNALGKTGGAKTHRHNFMISSYDYGYKPTGTNAGFGTTDESPTKRAGAYKYSTNEFSGGSRGPNVIINGVGAGEVIYDLAAVRYESTGDTDLGSSLQPYSTFNWIIKAN